MSATVEVPAAPKLLPSALPVLPALALALAVLALLFPAEIAAAAHVWNTSSAYGHCWLVLPIVAVLVYDRRYQAASVRSAPAFWPALLACPLAALWLASDVLGVMEGRQIALVGFIDVALLAALGPRQFRALSVAFLYLIFLVPFGAFLTGPLQDFTAAFVARGLDLLDVPNRVTQFQIEIPEGTFYVAEACAGLRFLIASVAFGVLYAVTIFRSPWRRAAFIAVSCVVPVVANGIRALGIVLLGHALGSAQAAAADHVLYGFIFFMLVIGLLALAGMPFRQDAVQSRPPPLTPPPATSRRAALAVLPVLALAAAGPAAALVLAARTAAPDTARPVLVAGPACMLTHTDPQGAVLLQTYRCGEATLTARTEMLPRHANPAVIARAGYAWAGAMVPGANTDNRLLKIDGPVPATWHLVVDEDSQRAAAFLVFVDGRPVLGGLGDRLRLARGDAQTAVALAVATDGGADVLQSFLEGQGDLASVAR